MHVEGIHMLHAWVWGSRLARINTDLLQEACNATARALVDTFEDSVRASRVEQNSSRFPAPPVFRPGWVWVWMTKQNTDGKRGPTPPNRP